MTASDPPADPAAPLSAELADQDRRAWGEQVRDPRRALVLGRAMAEQPQPLARALGLFHVGWAALRLGDPDTARSALAQQSDSASAHPAAAAAWRDLSAAVARQDDDHAQALQWLAPSLAMAEEARLPQAHAAAHASAALACGALHRMDDALRHFLRALAWAEASADEAWIAHAAGNVGAAHYDVYNLEEAAHWCRASLERAAASGAQGARISSTANLILVLCARAQHDQAVDLVRSLLENSIGMPAMRRAKYLTIAADVARACGDAELARERLDQAAALHASSARPLEWVGVQADLALDLGDAPAARAWVAQALAADRNPNQNDLPLPHLRLHECAVRACSLEQDWAAALRHQRQVMDLREDLLGRSARARRAALEVEYELQAARRQRDAAQAEQRRLAEVHAALAAAHHAQSDLLVTASHDLRQPVQALALQVAALQAEPASERQAAMTASVARSVATLSELFDGLLDLSRLNAGVVQPQWQVLDLGTLLATLVEQHQPQAHRKGLGLALRLPRTGPPLRARSDPLLLQRAVRNLLVNAIRHTQAGAILVALRQRPRRWRIEVRDSGPGIDPALQTRVFEPFFQASNTGPADGLGLGLAIVQRLATVLGLGLTLRSAPGRGTCVALELPSS